MIVRVAYAVPVRFLPLRGEDRVAHVRHEVEAEIPELPGSDFEPVPETLANCVCHRRGDALWIALRNPVDRDELAPAALREWLSGGPVERSLDELMTARLRRSPLVAGVEPGDRPADRFPRTIRASLAMPAKAPRHREILHDPARRVEAAARELMGEGFALVDGRLRMRVHPLATFSNFLPGGAARLDLFPFSHFRPDASGVADPVRFRDPSLRQGAAGVLDPDASLAAFERLLPDFENGADAVRWIATLNAHPMAAGMRRLAEKDATLQPLAGRIARMADLSTVGVMPDGGVQEAIDALRLAAEIIEANPAPFRVKGRELPEIAARFLSHPLDRPVLSGDDAMILQGLAP